MRNLPRDQEGSSKFLWAAVFFLCQVGALFAWARVEVIQAIGFLIAGFLMIIFPPEVRIPRVWWLFVWFFIIGGTLAFLPASLFGHLPKWRENLEQVGVSTGSLLVIQRNQAFENLAILSATVIFGVWLTGHRVSSSQLRVWTLLFSVGVAVYAIVAEIAKNAGIVFETYGGAFGFFPNRNHTATYLTLGTITGLGSALQSFRDRQPYRVLLALLSVGICLWATVDWSISRAGVVLSGLGCLIWLAFLGPKYLGSSGLKLIALLSLAIGGSYLIADTKVKNRLNETTAKVAESLSERQGDINPDAPALQAIDLRVPIALDTFDLIRSFPLTGVGAGQYASVMPQYRTRSIVASEYKILHPESDWLWILSEMGIVSFLALAGLVGASLLRSTIQVLQGRDRAIRVACLTAATIVVIHGVFDVPGHRIPIAWSAALLLTFSLRSSSDWTGRSPSALWSRLLGLVLISLGAWFAAGLWVPGMPRSRSGLAQRNLSEITNIYSAAFPAFKGLGAPDSEKSHRIDQLLEESSCEAPLDLGSISMAARVALYRNDKKKAAQLMEAARQILPYRIEVPLSQAEILAPKDGAGAVQCWKEAIRRAAKVDFLAPNRHMKEITVKSIQRYSRRNPFFKPLTDQAIAE